MPFRTFVDAEILTAAFVNDYLMEQATIICDSGSRPSGAGAPIEGMTIFETDTDRFLIYNGTSWIRVGTISQTGWTGVHVQRVALQSIPVGVPTAIVWDTVITSDSDDFIVPSSATLTIPTGLGGIYAATVATNWSAGVGTLGAYISVEVPSQTIPTHMGINATTGAANAVWILGAGNSVTVNAYHTASSSISLTAQLQLWRITA